MEKKIEPRECKYLWFQGLCKLSKDYCFAFGYVPCHDFKSINKKK